MQIKLAEALLRRKELQGKVNTAEQIKSANLYENKVQRISVMAGTDEVTANVAKLTLSQVTHEYDFYSRALRKIDAAIQQANWTSEISVDADAMADYMDIHGIKK